MPPTDELIYGFHPAAAAASDEIADLSGLVRAKSIELGADDVGFCRVDEAWLKQPDSLNRHCPDVGLSTVVVLIMAMDPECFRVSPSQALRDETNRGYERMAYAAPRLGQFIADLGYNALSCGNDTSDSVLPAIAAGLGKLGRNQMLIHDRFGPCLRICKVFTDMPLEVAPRNGSPLAEICQHCSLCAATCPGNAIEAGTQPEEGLWCLNRKRCSTHWRSVDRECANCISECPPTWRNGAEE